MMFVVLYKSRAVFVQTIARPGAAWLPAWYALALGRMLRSLHKGKMHHLTGTDPPSPFPALTPRRRDLPVAILNSAPPRAFTPHHQRRGLATCGDVAQWCWPTWVRHACRTPYTHM